MLSSHLPEWQLQFGRTSMDSSSHTFLALWWRQVATEQWMVWFMIFPSKIIVLERLLKRIVPAEGRIMLPDNFAHAALQTGEIADIMKGTLTMRFL